MIKIPFLMFSAFAILWALGGLYFRILYETEGVMYFHFSQTYLAPILSLDIDLSNLRYRKEK